MLGLMADKAADPNLRFKAAAESAKYVHPKPAGTSGDAAGAGPMIIDATSDADRARIDERLGRLDELSIRDFVMDDDLKPW
jgi:hypothetical protein